MQQPCSLLHAYTQHIHVSATCNQSEHKKACLLHRHFVHDPPVEGLSCEALSILACHNFCCTPLQQSCLDEQQTATLCRNEPHVHLHKEEKNPSGWHGAELSVTILGNWQYYRAKILRYMRQIAVITPYAQFTLDYQAEEAKNNLAVTFVRRTEKMPPAPQANPLPGLPSHKLLTFCAQMQIWPHGGPVSEMKDVLMQQKPWLHSCAMLLICLKLWLQSLSSFAY